MGCHKCTMESPATKTATPESPKVINLETLTAPEAERLAFAEGYPGTARLFARIADLQKALGEAVAEIESLKNTRDQLQTDLYAARHERAYPGDAD